MSEPTAWETPLPLTTQQREEIRRRYLDGETAKALSAEFGITVAAMRWWLPRKNGYRR